MPRLSPTTLCLGIAILGLTACNATTGANVAEGTDCPDLSQASEAAIAVDNASGDSGNEIIRPRCR